MESLLRFCLKNGGDMPEDAPPLDAERLQWLKEAMQHFTVELLDLVKTNVETIRSESSTTEDKITALEAIQDIVEDLDNARDLHLIGGFEPVIKLLNHEDPEVQQRAAEVVATVTQNNPVCQKYAEELGCLDQALPLVTHDDPQVAAKALRAVSCMIRGYPPLTKAFVAKKGFSRLAPALSSNHKPLTLKALFLLRGLISEVQGVVVASLLSQDQDVVDAMLKTTEQVDGEAEVWEHSLAVLSLLANSSDRFLPIYQEANLAQNLSARKDYVSKLEDQGPHQEEQEHAEELLKKL